MKSLFFFFSALTLPLHAVDIKTVWNRLDPHSISQALAFYELYSETTEGKEALLRASRLLTGMEHASIEVLSSYLQTFQSTVLTPEAIQVINELSTALPNRRLKGYGATNEAEVLLLPPEEIDLGKALLLSQLAGRPDALQQAESYCAVLDIMALQILAELPPLPTPEDKIRATNRLIFEKMHFRFPPHSIYSKEIDLYTFLPSVMDNHLGVCLGVAALYLAIAQRIDLPLEAITPPGHIYVRYRDDERLINIETTARGIDLPTEQYLNVNTRSLAVRTIKEVVGMTHFNQASLYLQNGNYAEAARCYEKASLYMPHDPLVNELLGFCTIFIGKKEEGRALLMEARETFPEGMVAQGTMPADYLEGAVDEEGIHTVFALVDETRESILRKQAKLQQVLVKFPHFREGLEHLAITWIQLNRPKEALEVLMRYHSFDASNPTVEYYLAVLHAKREDYAHCWTYLKNAETLTAARNFHPKALRELRKAFIMECPE